MKKTKIALIAVFFAAAAICTGSLIMVTTTTGRMNDLCVQSYQQILSGDTQGAMETLTHLAQRWQKALPVLEVIASHDDMHEVSEAIVNAEICIEFGEWDDCCRVLRQMGETLEHIRDMESLRLSNLY